MGQEVCSLSSLMKTQGAFQDISQFMEGEKFCRSRMKNVDNCSTFRDIASGHSNAKYTWQHAKTNFGNYYGFRYVDFVPCNQN